ncbi:MAG: c-type cytochrome [Anaerolinea sp.]|nr:c-type cytochrome [Anaerolinea sp.]
MKLKHGIVLCLLIIVASACSGLSSEPRIVASLPPPTPAPTEVGHPVAPPDMALGAALYAQHCVACHGVNGDGDGVLVREGTIVNPGVFSDPATASSQRPLDWHSTITNGRIDKLMPPWRDALTEEERWAVGFYTYTMHYTQAELERGAAIWVDECVECHGEGGRGDGERAAELGREVADLTYLDSMITQSDEVYYVTVTEGVGDNMPAYLDELSEADRWAVARYARTLALANVASIGRPNAEPGAPLSATAEVTAEAVESLTVSGAVNNGTVSGTVPAAQEMVLFVFDEFMNQAQFSATVGADGRYSLSDIPYSPGSVYVVTTNYRERVFASAVRRGDDLLADAADGTLDLPVTIYELTEDPAVITISAMVTQVNVVGDSLQVAQVLTLNNTSDRAFSSSETTTDGRNISAVIALPPGSVVTELPESNRYIVADDDFAVLDTIPVLPGDGHLIQLLYLIPYGDSAIIEQPLTYALDGTVRVLVNPPSVTVTSAQLPALGTETLGSGGTQYAAYGGTLTLDAGDAVRYDLSGTGLEVSAAGEVQTPSNSNLPAQFVLVLGGLALLVGGAYLIYYRTKSAPKAAADTGSKALIDALIAQIAELDAEHEAGNIPDEDYQRQRAALKQRLATLLDKS